MNNGNKMAEKLVLDQKLGRLCESRLFLFYAWLVTVCHVTDSASPVLAVNICPKGGGGGGIEQRMAFALPNPAAPSSNPGGPDNLLSMLPRFIDCAAA